MYMIYFIALIMKVLRYLIYNQDSPFYYTVVQVAVVFQL